uniref:Polysaccharide lyase 14 domain-containing protein n=1 Tax=uncultured Thiotrichaceae bacterium TaxID=298394 RepID=A0A6S6SJ23_9GAMM|nr:MAG: Unknown protein [uncultured Thiotrichaceae bacterium]
MKKILIVILLLAGPCAVFAEKTPAKQSAQATQPRLPAHKQDVRIMRTNNPKQPFNFAAKLQWNPSRNKNSWDKILVLYNGAKEPPENHPVWAYLKGLKDPGRGPSEKGENIGYKAFRAKAFCSGVSPLSSGKPMYVHFNNNRPGHYNEVDYLRDWNCPDWEMGLKKSRIVSGKEARDGKQSLRLNLPKYRSGCANDLGCYNWKPDLGVGLDSIYYSYWVKFPKSFDFVLGGKMPGIGSDKDGTGGGKPTGTDGFSVRAMWDSHGKMGQYVYHVDQPKHFGDYVEWDMPLIEKGKWYHIKTFVRLNTPGQRNGMIRTWVNNKQVLNRADMRFRNIKELKIQRFLFSVFFGGGGAEWAPKQDMILYMDDFVISAGKI